MRYGVGLDNVDIDVAQELGIAVGNVPEYGHEEISNHAIALLLALSRKLFAFDAAVRRGGTGIPAPQSVARLSQRTLGLVGYGRIGRRVAEKARAFGLEVVAYDPYASTADGVELLELDELLRRADILSLHVPLTPETRHMIGARELALLAPGSLVINIGRGGLVDEDALVAALHSGHIAGAALDVTEIEPLPLEQPAARRPERDPHPARRVGVRGRALRPQAPDRRERPPADRRARAGDRLMAVAERFIPGRAGVTFGAKLARRPDRVVKRVGGLSTELVRVAAGRGSAAPARGDRRFGDDAWSKNPVYSRLLRGYLAAGETLDGLLSRRPARRAGRAARALRARERARCTRADQLPADQPGCAARDGLASAAPTSYAARATSPATWPRRRGCRRASIATGSRSASTSRPRPARSSCAPSCSS